MGEVQKQQPDITVRQLIVVLVRGLKFTASLLDKLLKGEAT